ncbi:MAGE superfamily domain-containing protein [Histoplasma capsulatum]|uniref:MAGE superfamily domain-containing protein n=1 Tax=Ajellomyces capsulatus TaxID=5037 RepID=A0A8A1MJM7_AJECA|nr:MAGE superfamily domain-containing protein [Histoplasma capsulatum]
MPVVRNRRRAPDDEDESNVNSEASFDPQHGHSQRPTQQQKRQRRQASDSDSDASTDDRSTPEISTQLHRAIEVMVKKLVRLALASEYSRQVIRRTDIRDKVLGEQGSRQFRQVFEGAQRELMEKFGMQMVEQPLREKVTISQRRAAQRTERPATTTKTWTLTTILPAAYRTPAILPPTRAPSSVTESTYTAIYTFIISTILLSGGSIREQKLDRLLRRVNADNFTPIDRTDRLLARLCKEGYIVRNREMDGGEEVVEYLVGPRGKVEVGVAGVSGLVREVYGFSEGSLDGGDSMDAAGKRHSEVEAFEKRLKRSLGIREPLHLGKEDGYGDGDSDA